MFITRINQVKSLILLKLFSFFSMFSKKKRSVWVICERGTDARDNGFCFYEYLKINHPEIKVFYIIDFNSADYHKVKCDAVKYGSLKNYWVVARADKIISTHVGKCVPYIGGKPWKFSKMHNKFYFLQHGVISNNLNFLHKSNSPMKLFICGADPEYKYVKETFGHEDNIVQYTGLARYDKLHDIKTKKQILVMPTWRSFIHSEEDLLKSEYLKKWNDILSSKKINTLLQQNGYDLIFYPHYELQKYLNHFRVDSEHIKIASFKDYDVQILLKESALLITDFSSVFFDFGYMKKPIIYFHFDSKEFFSQHHQRGYFDYEVDGFGKPCLTSDAVADEIERCFKNEFVLDDIYAKRVERFFPLHDKNNCKRIYEKIVER